MPLVSVDIHAIPTVHTTDVLSLVSDSGITRLRVKAKIWDIYSNNSNKGDAYWHFPKGIYAEQYDSLFHVTGSIIADTAYHFVKTGLWRAIGNVVAKNAEGETFETSELFWDSKAPANSTNAFYTHKAVKITQADGSIMNGINGFRSDQYLKSVNLFLGQGEFNVVESPDSVRQNTVHPDSIRHP